MSSCYLFNVPSTDRDIVKREVGLLISRPGAVVRVTETGSMGGMRIIFSDADARDKLYAKRKALRIDGKPVVTVLKKQVLGDTTALVRSGLMNMAMRDRSRYPSLLGDVGVSVNWDKGGNQDAHTTVSSKSFDGLLGFKWRLQRELQFEVPDAAADDHTKSVDCRSAEELATTDILESVSPLQSRTAWPTEPKPKSANQAFCVVVENKYLTEVDRSDVLDEMTDGIVLLTDRDMVLLDIGLEQRLMALGGKPYATFRQRHLLNYGPLRPAECVVHKMDVLSAKYILHLSTDVSSFARDVSDMLLVHLINCYESALTAASRAGLTSVAISIIATEFATRCSAEAAVSAIKTVIAQSHADRLPTRIRFVDQDLEAVQAFGEVIQMGFGVYTPGVIKESKGPTVIKESKGPTASRKGMETSKSQSNKLWSDEEDARKLPIATGTSVPKVDPATASFVTQLIDEEVQPPQSKTRNQLYGEWNQKRRVDEKKAPTISKEDKKRMDSIRTEAVLRELASWPDQLKCWYCDGTLEPMSPESTAKLTPRKEAMKESCLCCHRRYHVKCFDESGGICMYCFNAMRMLEEGRCLDQPFGGRMEVQVVEDENRSPPGFPDSRGHIEITYVFGCGTKLDPLSSAEKFYFGCTRMAYLPNNADGKRLCELLRVAFDRGLTMTTGELGVGFGHIGVVWGCIPHKLSLSGGREKWGYPDDTYLSRTETLLKEKFGIEKSMLGQKAGERQQG